MTVISALGNPRRRHFICRAAGATAAVAVPSLPTHTAWDQAGSTALATGQSRVISPHAAELRCAALVPERAELITRVLPELADLKVAGTGKPPKRPISMLDLLRHAAGFAYSLGVTNEVDRLNAQNLANCAPAHQHDAAGRCQPMESNPARPSAWQVRPAPRLISDGGGAMVTMTDGHRCLRMPADNGSIKRIRVLAPATVKLTTHAT